MALTCSPKDKCVHHCDADVAVKVDAKPKARCFQKSGSPIRGQLELDIDFASECKFYEVKKYKSHDGCNTKCLFEFELPWTCDARVVQSPCNSGKGEVKVEVEIPVRSDCKVIRVGEHKNRHHQEKSKSHSRSDRHESQSKSRSQNNGRHHGVPIQRQKAPAKAVAAPKKN